MPGKRIAVIGTLDTKGAEHAYVADCLREFGHEPLLIDLVLHRASPIPRLSQCSENRCSAMAMFSSYQRRH